MQFEGDENKKHSVMIFKWKIIIGCKLASVTNFCK